jgi:hypothetical protein
MTRRGSYERRDHGYAQRQDRRQTETWRRRKIRMAVNETEVGFKGAFLVGAWFMCKACKFIALIFCIFLRDSHVLYMRLEPPKYGICGF